jgi:hypothetical protein
MITDSLYSQVDADGREFIFMKEIVDHRSNWIATVGRAGG